MSVPEYFIGSIYAWLAAEDTARPADPIEEPAAAWVLMGTGTNAVPHKANATVRLTDEGVTWEVPQTINGERDLNEIFQSDAFRVEADQMIGFSLKDFRAEVIRKALNDAAIGDVAATKSLEIGVSAMGVAVAKHALLVRVDNSPYPKVTASTQVGPYISEFWGPSVYEMSNFTTALGSRAVSMVPFQFMSLLSMATANAANRMGSWRFQNID
jgi:hypothetical protein